MDRLKFIVAGVLSAAVHMTCQAGIAEGLNNLEAGKYSDGFNELLPLAEQGVPFAQWLVGNLYFGGKGVDQDQAAGMAWHVKAAEAGLAQAQLSIGDAYFMGMSAKQDAAEAMKWYQRAAAQGLPQALFNVGSMLYSSGRGMQRNIVSSYRWCLLSAHGSPAGSQRERALLRCDRVKPQLSVAEVWQANKMASEFVPKPEMTQDLAGRIYSACMKQEELVAKAADPDFSVMHAHAVCNAVVDDCRYSNGVTACDAGRQKYGVE